MATASKSAVRWTPLKIRAAGAPVWRRRKNRSHARGELAQAERFGDVVVGPEVQPRDAIGLGRPRRQHDDQDVGGGGPAA